VDNNVWASTFQRIEVFNAKDYSLVMSLEGHTNMVHDLILIGGTVWSCSSDKEIRVWSTEVRCCDDRPFSSGSWSGCSNRNNNQSIGCLPSNDCWPLESSLFIVVFSIRPSSLERFLGQGNHDLGCRGMCGTRVERIEWLFLKVSVLIMMMMATMDDWCCRPTTFCKPSKEFIRMPSVVWRQ